MHGDPATASADPFAVHRLPQVDRYVRTYYTCPIDAPAACTYLRRHWNLVRSLRRLRDQQDLYDATSQMLGLHHGDPCVAGLGGDADAEAWRMHPFRHHGKAAANAFVSLLVPAAALPGAGRRAVPGDAGRARHGDRASAAGGGVGISISVGDLLLRAQRRHRHDSPRKGA